MTRPLLYADVPGFYAQVERAANPALAERPVIVAGRGAALSAGSREALLALGESVGALLATSAMAHGLFAGHPYSVGIAGGFASPPMYRRGSSSKRRLQLTAQK